MTWHRIDAYRNKTGKTLDEVAEDLEVSKSMLMMVKSGRRNLSGKALYRLDQAEKEAGIVESTREIDPSLSTRGQGKTLAFSPKNSAAMREDRPGYGTGVLADLAALRRDIAGLESELTKRLEGVKSGLDELERKIKRG